MFNFLDANSHLFFLSLISCFIILVIRHLFIKRILYIILYHFCIFIPMFIFTIGGGGVANDGYQRLDEFILLEKNNQLESARKNSKEYGMLGHDLEQFKNSTEFKNYLEWHDRSIDKDEYRCIGWLFALLSDIAIGFTVILAAILRKAKSFVVRVEARQ